MDKKASEATENISQNNKKESFASDVLTLAGGTTFAQILTILSAPVLTRLYGPKISECGLCTFLSPALSA